MTSVALRDRLRQGLNLLTAASQFPAAVFSRLTDFGQPIEARMGTITRGLEEPATWAFLIWFLIFALAVAYGIYQAMPRQRNHPLLRRVGFFTATAFLANSAWMIAAQLGAERWALLALIVVILASSLVALFRSADYRGPLGLGVRVLARPLIGLLAGWISVATFLALAAAVKAEFGGSAGVSPETFAIVVLLSAAAFAMGVLIRCRGAIWCGFAVNWGFAAIAIANHQDSGNTVMAALATIITFVVAGVMLRYYRAAYLARLGAV